MTAVAAFFFVIGFYILLCGRISMLPLAFLMIGNGANLSIFAGAGLNLGAEPLLGSDGKPLRANLADPVAQALVLTAIVIGFGLLVYVLALCLQLIKTWGVDRIVDLRQEDEP